MCIANLRDVQFSFTNCDTYFWIRDYLDFFQFGNATRHLQDSSPEWLVYFPTKYPSDWNGWCAWDHHICKGMYAFLRDDCLPQLKIKDGDMLRICSDVYDRFHELQNVYNIYVGP